jgi:DNA-directed RNA polymerase subunit RPC12/RpoP
MFEMKQEEETKVLICLPVEGPPGRYIVPGSVEANCCDCGVRVYVAPSGRKLQESGKCIIVCTKCGLRRLEQEKEPKFEVVPGQDKEIRDRLCRD